MHDVIKILLRSATSFCCPNTNIINRHNIIPIISECNTIIQCCSILYNNVRNYLFLRSDLKFSPVYKPVNNSTNSSLDFSFSFSALDI